MIYKISNLDDFTGEYDAVTIGVFDSVHRGHRILLEKLKSERGSKLIITFSIAGGYFLLNDEKYNMLEEMMDGTVDVLVLDLSADSDVKSSTYLEFMKFLKRLNVSKIIVGEKFRFGHQALGTVNKLQENFEVDIVKFLKENGKKISTRDLKKKLQMGNLIEVNRELGYNYYVDDVVREGNQLGRTLNFPTVNIEGDAILLPNGVYKTKLHYDGKIYNSITNIGNRPTVTDEKVRMIETHIYDDFSKEIYGENVRVEFFEFIRGEKKFENVEELKEQIKRDIEIVKEKDEN